MKFAISLTMMLLISMLAINPAFGTTSDDPEANGECTYGAPNSGDGIPDGSGWDHTEVGAPNSGDGIPDGSGWEKDDRGAPNSGDGIPDGSGWDAESCSPYPLILFVS